MFSITAPIRGATFLLIALMTSTLAAGNAVIRFDLPPTVAATASGQQSNTVLCQFRVSSLIATPGSPAIDQWLVVCQPRDPELMIVDYSPKTDAESDIDGPIEVKSTDESSASLGLSIDGNYFARASLGADQCSKSTDSRQYAVTAPRHAVTASGTINRGRGVYFKLRRSARQILEGDKIFKLVLRVPDHWRGSLIDVSIIAQSLRSKLAGLDKQVRTMGQSNFVVAAYREGDQEAARLSRKLADAEQALRQLARRRVGSSNVHSLTGILRRVAVKLDLQPPEHSTAWVWRLLTGDADPYLDKEIQQLPINLRLAALDYCEIRDDFTRLADCRRVETTDRVAAQSLEAR
jgi:hypothetical protein